jgi:hypothetical protein
MMLDNEAAGTGGGGGAGEQPPDPNAELKRQVATLIGENRKKDEKLRLFDGIDPVAVRSLLAEKEKAESDALKAKGDWDSRENALREAFKKEKAPLEQRVAKMEQTLFKVLGEKEAISSITEAKGKVKPLLGNVLPFLRVVEHESEFVVRVVDQQGKERIADSQGNPMTVQAFVNELRGDADYADLFLAATGSGGGAPPGGGAAAPKPGTVIMVDPRDKEAMVRHAHEIRTGEAKVMQI